MVALSVLLGVGLLFWVWALFTFLPTFLPHYPQPQFGGFSPLWIENTPLIDQPLRMFMITVFLLSVHITIVYAMSCGGGRRLLWPERAALAAGFILIAGPLTLAVTVGHSYPITPDHVGLPGWLESQIEESDLRQDAAEARYRTQIHDRQVFLPDADTLRIDGKDYRLWGIDALQAGQFCLGKEVRWFWCGKHARKALLELLNSVPPKEIDCFYPDQAHYPNTVSCRAGGVDVGEWLVRHGHAFPTETGRHRYRDALAEARSNKAGAWNTTFLFPWEWKAATVKVGFRGSAFLYPWQWSTGHCHPATGVCWDYYSGD
ncbi:MAG: thermonuclease family protein [Alphaproteobacteria bacterium]